MSEAGDSCSWPTTNARVCSPVAKAENLGALGGSAAVAVLDCHGYFHHRADDVALFVFAADDAVGLFQLVRLTSVDPTLTYGGQQNLVFERFRGLAAGVHHGGAFASQVSPDEPS